MSGVSKTRTAIAGTALALALSTALSVPAVGRPRPVPVDLTAGSDAIVTTGTCDAGSTWTLSGRSRFLRIVVEARIATNQPRSRWVLRVRHNQVAVARVSRKSNFGGLVKVKGRVRNQMGPDTFTFIARSRTTGETCQGTLTF